MINVRRHNPQLRSRLLAYVESGDAQGLCTCLSALSNMDFRTAGYLLAEDLLLRLPSVGEGRTATFWQFFSTIVPSNSKAYLVTFLKAAAALYGRGELSLSDTRLADYAAQPSTTPVDRRKTLEHLLPCVRTAAEASMLLQQFAGGEAAARIPFLLKAGTPVCYYLLFHTLKTLDEDRELLRHCCLSLVRKGDRLSFNLACIIRHYFDVADLPATFSLQLRPYQLGRLDDSFESFMKILE